MGIDIFIKRRYRIGYKPGITFFVFCTFSDGVQQEHRAGGMENEVIGIFPMVAGRLTETEPGYSIGLPYFHFLHHFPWPNFPRRSLR